MRLNRHGLRGKTSIRIAVLLIIMLLVTATSTFADAAPKPSLDIEIENLEGAHCLVDLLVKPSDDPLDEPWVEYKGNMTEAYAYLKNYSEDGYYAAMATGQERMSGYFESTIVDGVATVNYGYMIPSTFKIIVITDTGEIHVSDEIQRRSFNSYMTYDVKSGKVKESTNIIFFLLMFAVTFAVTFIIEMLVLMPFGLNTGRHRKIVLAVNAVTQALLWLSLYLSAYYLGLIFTAITLIIMECLIFIGETITYTVKFDHESKRRKILYGLCANLASLILGPVLVIILFSF